MNFAQSLTATAALSYRELLRFVRQRSRVIGAFLTPVIFWILLGFGIDSSSGGAAVGGAQNFKQFFVPGMMIMGVLFTAIYAAISLIDDRNSGFYQGVLVSPLPKWSWMLSKIFGASMIAVLQGLMLIPLAYASGLHPSLLDFATCLLLFWMIAVFIAALSLHFGWRIESVAGFHGIMNTVLMPMWFLSGSTFPLRAGTTMAWIASVNPLTYAVRAFQDVLFHANYAQFPLAVIVLAAVSVLLFSLSLLQV